MKKDSITDAVSVVLVSIATILYYLTVNGHLATFIYSLMALAFAVWFFPLKHLISRDSRPDEKGRFVYKIADPLISFILASSIAALFDADEIVAIKIIIMVLTLGNTVLLFYHYFKNSRRYYVVIHAIVCFLTAAIAAL